MLEISISKVVKSYGFKNILDEISFDILTGERISLIGDNGCGKSTLLKIIDKEESLDKGSISYRKGISIGYLPQEVSIDKDITVKEFLYEEVKDIIDLKDKLEFVEKKLSYTSDLEKLLNKYGKLQERFIALNGYEVDSKINKIITGFKIERLINQNLSTVSGGEKRIVYLAKIMINNPSVLLLDEPTNHLDIDTLSWFEDYLKNYTGTVLIVSHDRYFLDKVSTKTILIERGKEHIFHGNYSCFLKENEKRLEIEFKEYKDQQKLIQALKKKAKQLHEFGVRAYPCGENFFKREKNILKRIERLNLKDKPIEKKNINLEFNEETRTGKDVLSINKYNLYIGDKLLIENINLLVNYQDRLCIMGTNGCGKSTFIKEIINNNPNFKYASKIKIGYIPQEIEFNTSDNILEYASKFYVGDYTHLRSSLANFNFFHDNVYKKVKNLSGGEKVRLKLFELMQENCNLLILDEVTNHIDIATKEVLEEALNEFNGTIIFISHDRYFINNIATKIAYIINKKMNIYDGNYNYFDTYRQISNQ